MKPFRLIIGVVTVVGLGMLIGGIFSIQHMRRFLATAVPVRGVVTENVYSGKSSDDSSISLYSPRIQFRTNDRQNISFISRTASSPPQYHVDQPVTVFYDPQQPYRAYIGSIGELWEEPVILTFFGVVFSSTGVVAVVWKGMTVRKNAWLRQNGRPIQADFTRVEVNQALSVNGLHPYHIVCQWRDPATNQLYIFNSANIWFDPTNYIQGKTVRVLLDPENPRRYLVDPSLQVLEESGIL